MFYNSSFHNIGVSFRKAQDDILIGGVSGLTVSSFLEVNGGLILTICSTLVIPFLKEFGEKVIIPYVKKKLKIK
jgi:hypothetical protein